MLNSSAPSPHVLMQAQLPTVLALASHSLGSITEPPTQQLRDLAGPWFLVCKMGIVTVSVWGVGRATHLNMCKAFRTAPGEVLVIVTL